MILYLFSAIDLLTVVGILTRIFLDFIKTVIKNHMDVKFKIIKSQDVSKFKRVTCIWSD